MDWKLSIKKLASFRILFIAPLAVMAIGCTKATPLSQLLSELGTFGFSTTSTNLPVAYEGRPYIYNFATNNGVGAVTYTVTTGSLPGGVTLATDGILSGTVTGTSGNYGFTVLATDSSGQTVSSSMTLTVELPFQLLTTSLVSAVVNETYTAVFSASGGVSPYTFAATGLPTGLTLNASTGVLSGTATTIGNYNLTVTVNDSSGQSTQADIALNVGVIAGNPSISTSSLPNGTLGSTYVAAITVTGGMTPFTFSVSVGTLPSGLTLSSTSGVLTGIPTATGTSNFTIQVLDALGNMATKSYSLTIMQSPAPSITTTSLAAGEVSIPYSNLVLATGGTPPYTFSISTGSLPSGLSIAPSTGVISGTPTVTGTSSFTVKVLDSLGSSTVGSLSLTIDASPYQSLAIENSTLLPMSLGINDSRTILATGGLPPYTFAVTSGSLPSGVSLNSTTGLVSGIPGALGTFSFIITVTDARMSTASQAYALQVTSPLLITTTSLPVSIVNEAYSVPINASGGTSPYSFSATGLPSGLNVSSSGVLSGTATASGTSSVEVSVTDANGLTALQSYSLVVAGALTMTTTTVQSAAVLKTYSQTLVSSGGVAPYSFTLASGSLPAGLNLSSAGVISGTPTKGANAKTGSFSFSVLLSDSSGQSATKAYSMTVTIPPTVMDDISNKLRPGAVGVHYTDWALESGGVRPLTFSATGLPSGLSINSTSGVVSGTPAAGTAGSYTVSFTVTDSLGFSATRNKSLTIVSSGKTAAFDGGITTWVPNSGQYDIDDLEAADLNHDGILDLVAVSYGSTQAVILLGNGDGTFNPYYLTLTHQPVQVAIADMNNDGKVDLVFSESNNTLEIVQGDGVWTNPAGLTKQQITTNINNNGGQQIALGDLNGDGRLDIALANYSANDILVFMNCGSNATVSYNSGSQSCTAGGIINYYAPAATLTVNNAKGVGLVDLTGNGDLDLIATNWTNSTVYIFQGYGNGTFNTTASYTQSFAYNTGYVRTFLEPTSATGWGTTTSSGVPSSANAYYTASSSFIDMNQDGKRDFVVQANYGAYIFLGNKALGVSQVWTADNSSYGSGAFTKVASIDGSVWPAVITTITGGGVTWMNSGANYGTLVYQNTETGSGSVGSPSFIPGTNYASITLGEFITGSTAPALAEARNWSSNVGAPTLVIVRPNTSASPYFESGLFQFAYENASNYLDNFNLASLAVGDVNQDGKADVVTKGFSNEAIVNIGNGNGTFNTESEMLPTGELGAQWWNRDQVVLADIDGDGILDFATADWNSGTFSSVDYSIGNGDGTFGSTTYISTDASGCISNLGTESVAIGDFNGDGKPDMAIGQGCNGNGLILVYLGNGDGTFNTASPYTINAGYGSYVDLLTVQDINGDGILDLVAVTRNGYLQLYFGVGNGTFTQKSVSNLNISTDASALEIGDLNGDGIPDYVISAVNYGSFAVALGGAGGTISSISAYSGLSVQSGQNGASVKLVDWNADGKLDVLFVKQRGGGVMYFKGNGDGTFTQPSYLYSLPSPGAYAGNQDSLFSVDLNGDGLPDILVTNGDNNSMSSLGISINESH